MRRFSAVNCLFSCLFLPMTTLMACANETQSSACAECASERAPSDGDKSQSADPDTLSDAAPSAPRPDATTEQDASYDAAPQQVDASTESSPEDSGATGDAGFSQEDGGSRWDSGTPASRNQPADLLDLSYWKLTVPVDTEQAGSPDEYKNPALQSLTLEPHFTLSPSKDSVLFRAHAGGATTKNSLYPRSELREMQAGGAELASWSTSTGVHRMRVRQAITHLPLVKPHVVSAQIHDADDDVVMIRLQGKHLFVESDGTSLGSLDQNYELGTIFTVELVAANDTIDVFYNGVLKVSLERTARGCYFKAGCYTQSNVARGDAPDAYAEVAIYELLVSHE